MKTIRTPRLGTLLLPVSFAALLACGSEASLEQAGGAPPAPMVGVQVPIQRQVTDWGEFTGRLAPVESVQIRARVSGFVDQVHFDEGALVEAGDLLMTLDPRTFRAELASLQGGVNEAQARLDLARSEAKRVEPLIESRAVSTEEVEQRRRAVETAEAALSSEQAGLEKARLDLEFTRVVSPVSGRVGRAHVTRGNLVSGGSGDSTVLTTVVSLDPMYFYFTPDERTARRLLATEGDSAIEVELQLTDETGYPHQGTVDFFDNQVDPDTGTLQMRAVFSNENSELLPGMFGRIRVRIGDPRSALLVPDASLGRDQTQEILYVVGPDDTVERRVVTTGSQVGGLRVIETGLTGDDRVVVEGLQRVRPGVAVVVQPISPETTDGAPDS